MPRADGLDGDTREPLPETSVEEATPRPALTILFHPDIDRVGDRCWVADRLELSRLAPSLGPVLGGGARAIEDEFVSRRPLLIDLSGPSIRFEWSGSGSGTPVIDGEPLSGVVTRPRSALTPGIVLELSRRVVLLLHLASPTKEAPPRHALVGDSDAILRLRRDLERIARSEAPVLIRGETGTGKELAAQAIHQASRRAQGPFVGVNLAAVPAQVAASELFGHKKGAFTGATADHEGYFGRADGGILFLDEIGEAPLDLQVMLLRALETGQITPLGATTPRSVDVRLLTATDADLEGAIERGTFRPALLHRLSGLVVRVPRLAERPQDIGQLLAHFWRLERQALPPLSADTPWAPPEIIRRLVNYPWPGNVRQLRNVARQLAAYAEEGAGAQLRALDEILAGPMPTTPTLEVPREARRPAEVSDEEILSALAAAGYRIGAAANALGISRTSLYRRIERHPDLQIAKSLTAEAVAAVLLEHPGDLPGAARALKISVPGLRLRMSELGLVRAAR